MESLSFNVIVDNTSYGVKLHSENPKLYDVTHGKDYHLIGKTDAGLWVYVDATTENLHMPLQQIGDAIEEYLTPGV